MQTQTSHNPIDNPTRNPAIKGKGWNYKIDVDKAIELRFKGLSYADIAKHFGVDKTSVWEKIHHLLPDDLGDIDTGKKHLGNILLSDVFRFRKYLTDEKLQKAPAGTLSLMMCQMYDKYRLETGQSTENISVKSIVHSLSNDRDDLAKKKAALLSYLDTPDTVTDVNGTPDKGK